MGSHMFFVMYLSFYDIPKYVAFFTYKTTNGANILNFQLNYKLQNGLFTFINQHF